jgi:predicted nucleic acid-binding protein
VALIVVDAGVVIALRSPQDAHHTAAVAAFERYRHDELVLPASAYAEILVEPAASGAAALRRAKRIVDAFPLRIEPVTRDIAERAAVLRTKLRLPDALVVATGELIGAEAILTADRRWATASRRVRVI